MSFFRHFFSAPAIPIDEAPIDKERKSFFSSTDWLAFWTSTLLSFLVYFLTCAPSVTLEDSGELAVAGDYAGVPHPPGYPSWTICAWLFSRLLGWIPFRGHPNPAWAIAVMSAFWGAIAIGLTALLISRSCDDILSTRQRPVDLPECKDNPSGIAAFASRSITTRLICWLSGCAGALVFAFSPVMWSQCTIVEVYSFNAFFLMLLLVLTYRWIYRPSNKLLIATAFLFGLGLTNYQVLLLAIIPLILVILLQDIHLFRDFVLAGLPLALLAFLLKLAAEPSRPGFPKYPFLDPVNPVVGSLALGAKKPPILNTPEWTQIAEFTDRVHLGIILAIILLAVGGAFLGLLSRRENAPEIIRKTFPNPLFPALLFGSGILLALVILGFLPAAPEPPYADPSIAYSWKTPLLTLFAGWTILWLFSAFTPETRWYAGTVSVIEFFLFLLIRRGCLLGLTHPDSGYFVAYAALFALLIVLAWIALPNGRTVSLSFLAGGLGLAFYLYMPVSGDACPPMNWGYPRTWEGFKHAISRGQYEQITPTTVFSPAFLPKLGSYFSDLRTQFTLLLAPFGFLAFADWVIPARSRDNGSKPIALVPWLLLCTAAIAGITIIDKISGTVDLTETRIDKLFFLPLFLAAFIGLHYLALKALLPLLLDAICAGRTNDLSRRIVAGASFLGIALLLCGLALGFANTFSETILEATPLSPSSSAGYVFFNFILTSLFFFAWVGIVVFAAFRIVRNRSTGIAFPVSDFTIRWHLATFTCFVMMSFVLIALANPSGDIQDAFIQKVKFIASHGIFAIWIGYGFAYLLATLRTNRTLFAGAALAIALTPLLPIHENYFNFRLADTTSAAEQNRHDFGWQFGNYQLRGAEAISEELSDDEEPLPNPCFPEAMTTNAVFFGGTDPGRFVPTYMIYSANVRPDVFLITQNALADNTYLDTMRSLYADDIWMPTANDCTVAFQEYIDDVESGRRPNIGGIVHDPSGRVSVNGAQAVMEINGIIARQIFTRNKDHRDFYVEESYTIPWMTPFLIPHGLIMKLSNAPAPISAPNRQNDMDFWDWYSRRLIATPAFHRDLPARKAFNKLRCAIAGNYAARGQTAVAERAYKQAQSLYIYSPETTLRLIQEILLPANRFDEAVALLRQLQTLDPNNTRLPIQEIRKIRDSNAILEPLLKRLGSNTDPLSETEALALVQAALDARKPAIAAQAINAAYARNAYGKRFYVNAGLILLQGGLAVEAAYLIAELPEDYLTQDAIDTETLRQLVKYLFERKGIPLHQKIARIILKRDPNDWKTWIQFSAGCIALNENDRALKAIKLARSIGGREADAYLRTKFPELILFSETGSLAPLPRP